MHTLRTPDARFANLPDYLFAPHYIDIDGMRMHYVDEGSPGAAPVLLMHGEPTWSYLYRKMIPIIGDAGHRAVAPDLIGFGKSDKPAQRADYTYARHVGWMAAFLEALDLRNITLVCQDWGSLIGLRLAAEHEDRFDRIVLANGALPAGHGRAPMVFRIWQQFARWTPIFPIGRVVNAGCVTDLSPEVIAAYDAPFPDETYKQGARAFPALVPTRPNDPAAADNQRAWEVFHRWRKPFLTAFSDGDPITRGGERAFQSRVPSAQGQPHTTIRGAGHFLQEDKGPELARVVVEFIDRAC
jgi:haloalkane dehalogenase